MEYQEQHNAEVRMEIDELKSGMTKLTEMLQVLIARGEPPQKTVIVEVSSADIDPQPTQQPPSTWPEFGLPHGYTPPYEKTPGIGQSSQLVIGQASNQVFHAPVFTESQPIVHTVAQPTYVNPLFEYQAARSQNGSQGDAGDIEDVKEQYHTLEKRLRAMEGNDYFGVAAENMCLVSNFVMPAKFKTPEFEKYKGNTCPRSHLTMYYRKMAAYTQNDKLLIHCFQDSLSGASLKWYMGLESNHIHCFQDLTNAFMKQYKYNLDMAPDRRQLQNVAQKEKESFKEYAQRWRELASQVEPPLAEKELTGMFMDTLSPFYWEKMIGSVSSNFTDLVTIGQRLEEGIKNGKVANVAESSGGSKKPYGNFHKKKENETNAVSDDRRGSRRKPQNGDQPYVAAVAPVQVQVPQSQVANQNQNRGRTTYDPIPMTYTELYPALVQKGLITTRAMPPPRNPPSRGFRPDLHCEFHQGGAGHDLEGCYALKALVQELVRAKMLSFRDMGPNVVTNPLPEQSG
ncbi:uncharacterized protein LOC131601309 [Vicia villosa]|uniref:uncharacterized protein LOC131601309 n=1 Tax=Vicia villosa TaxID=3911 RepID=UPI00273B0A62|nr:uncharacterized protein LOC131601309 [Vicia villosa]